MARIIVRRSGPEPGDGDPGLAARKGIAFREIEICSRRIDAAKVELWVEPLSGGSTVPERCVVRANESKLRGLDIPFQAPIERAVKVGHELAEVLLASPIYRQLQRSIRRLDTGSGLRVRLALDSSLISLPWEFTYRRDLSSGSELPGFLFLDPKLSIVQGVARKSRRLVASSDAQRLVSLGNVQSR